MAEGHECVHCKAWIPAGQFHDCWTTTEGALTRHLDEDLREAWERLREAAADLGEQRIYASHHSIMFSRRTCYCFVRPKKAYLEVCVFLDHPLTVAQMRRVDQVSKTKWAHLLRVTHRDQVEAPLTDWMRDAYARAGQAPQRGAPNDGREAPRRRAAKKR